MNSPPKTAKEIFLEPIEANAHFLSRQVPRTNHMSNDQVTRSSTYSTWLLAFRNSASVTAFSVVVVGALFLPKEIARLQANPEMSVRHCLLTSDRRSLVAVMDVNSKEPATALHHHLRLHEFSGDTASSRLLLLIAHPASIGLDTSGNRLFVGDGNGDLTLLHLGQPDVLYSAFGHGLQGPAKSMGCSEDGKTLVVLDRSALYAWDITHDLIPTPRWCQMDSSIGCFAMSPDSKSVICSRNRGKSSGLIEIEIHTGVTRLVRPRVGQQLQRIIISPDGRFMACVQHNCEVVLLHRDSPSQAWRPCSIPSLHSGATNIACFAPQSTLPITSNAECNQLIAWDLERMEQRLKFDRQSSLLLGCEFLDDEQILSWNQNGTLQTWNLGTPAPIREIML